MAVPIQTSGGLFTFGKPARVFDTKYAGNFYSYDVAPDGRRFLMMKDSPSGGADQPRSIVVVLNWLEEVRRRMPAR